MLNGAAISFTSKRHTTTDDSTTAAELTEQYLCVCDAEGLRNLMAEVGLHQERPTIIYQDNQPAIHISMNRGALSKKTRAMDMRVLTTSDEQAAHFRLPDEEIHRCSFQPMFLHAFSPR